MKELARLSVRGRRGQTMALAATVLFAAVLIGIFGVLLQTGVQGQVSTGEYARAPILLGRSQSIPVSGDTDMAIPGRALLPASFVNQVKAVLPKARVVVDRIVPATVLGPTSDPVSVDAHPWSAFALGSRTLSAGRAPATATEIVVPGQLARSLGLPVGHPIQVGFGDAGRTYTVVGLTSAADDGTDVPDVYLADDEQRSHGNAEGQVAALGVWPAKGDRIGPLEDLARRHGAKQWNHRERGQLEVVSQGAAKSALVSVAGAAGALAFIVAVFTVLTLTALQIRERSRELAMLRVVGATPRQVKKLLRREIRTVALAAGVAGAVLGPVLGAVMVRAIRSWGVLPQGIQPALGPLPFVIPVVVALAAAEIAARIALRRVVRGSPLALLEGVDEHSRASVRSVLRTVLGVLLLAGGLVMAGAPWYASGEATSALPGLSGLVIALSVGPLAPVVVRAAARVVRRAGRHSAPAYLALNAVGHRAARVGAALAPIVLGTALACVQLFVGPTMNAVATDQFRTGYRADLMVTSTTGGVGQQTADLLRATPGVTAVTPLVTTNVIARVAGSDTQQTLGALAASDEAVRYADLDPTGHSDGRLRPGEVALGVQGAAVLDAHVRDTLTIVLPDGRSVSRRVAFLYRRGLGFGELLAPLQDLQPATPSGQASAVAITVDQHATNHDVAARIRRLLADRPGLDVAASPPGAEPTSAPGDTNFQLLILLVIFGYIAIAVVNSLIITTLARRTEFGLLAAVGATPRQRRRVPRWEAVFLATTACILGTAAALPGLAGVAYALSNGERLLPTIDVRIYLGIVVVTFALVLGATAFPARSAMRTRTR